MYLTNFLPMRVKLKKTPALLLKMPTYLRNGSKRVGFSPHNTNEPTPVQSLGSYINTQSTRSKFHCEVKACRWSNKQTPNRFSSSPARLLRRIKVNVVRTLSLFSIKPTSCSRNGSCSKNSPSDPIPIHFIPSRDSHHSEALEDCIEFINSSHRKSL